MLDKVFALQVVVSNSHTALFNNIREDSASEHHQMDNTEIRLIIFFPAKDGEALYSKQKQNKTNLELTVAHIMSSSLQNSDLK